MLDTNKLFNGLFGKVQPGMCRLTMNGNVAVKCSSGYKSYNVKTGRLTNVTSFCFNIGEEFFFVIPTNKASKGDIILIDGKPKCVIEAEANKITVIDYESSEIRQVLPERHVFMGNTYFYGKIVSMFGSSFKSGKGLGNIMKMMMMSQMFGGTQQNMGSMGQMMAMSMFMSGKDNPFEDMFSEMSFDIVDEESEEETNKTEE